MTGNEEVLGAGLKFTFEGGDADSHLVDMRLMGRSLIGIDRLLSDGMIVLGAHRMPRRGERAPVAVKAREPLAGSSVVLAQLGSLPGTLPLIWDFVASGNAKTVLEFASFVLKMRGGRKADAQAHLDAMLEQMRISEAARDRSEQRWHDSMGKWVGLLHHAVDKLSGAAKSAVAPIGPSVNSLKIGNGEGIKAEIDVPMADAIRDGADLVVGDQETLVVSVDGYTHHNRSLKIARLDGDGFMSAAVTDPVFDQLPNIYTEAAAIRAKLLVECKKTTQEGRVVRIHISNALKII